MDIPTAAFRLALGSIKFADTVMREARHAAGRQAG